MVMIVVVGTYGGKTLDPNFDVGIALGALNAGLHL